MSRSSAELERRLPARAQQTSTFGSGAIDDHERQLVRELLQGSSEPAAVQAELGQTGEPREQEAAAEQVLREPEVEGLPLARDGSLLAGITNFERTNPASFWEWNADLINIIYLVANDTWPGVSLEDLERKVAEALMPLRTRVENGMGDVYAIYVDPKTNNPEVVTIHLRVVFYVDIVDRAAAGPLIEGETNPCVNYVYVTRSSSSNTERNFAGSNQGIFTTTNIVPGRFLELLTHYSWHANDARYKYDQSMDHEVYDAAKDKWVTVSPTTEPPPYDPNNPATGYEVGGHNDSSANSGNMWGNRKEAPDGINFHNENSLMSNFSQGAGQQLIESDYDALSSPEAQEWARKNHRPPVLFQMTDREGQLLESYALGTGVLNHVFEPEDYKDLLDVSKDIVEVLAAHDAQIVPNPDLDRAKSDAYKALQLPQETPLRSISSSTGWTTDGGISDFAPVPTSSRYEAAVKIRDHIPHEQFTMSTDDFKRCIEEGIAKTFNIKGSADHNHTVTISKEQFEQLAARSTIEIEIVSSTSDASYGGEEHTHNIVAVPSEDGTEPFTTTIRDNHQLHEEFTVSADDIEAGIEKTYDIRGTADHSHTMTISEEQIAQLAAGSNIEIVSSTSDASDSLEEHTHRIVVVSFHPRKKRLRDFLKLKFGKSRSN